MNFANSLSASFAPASMLYLYTLYGSWWFPVIAALIFGFGVYWMREDWEDER